MLEIRGHGVDIPLKVNEIGRYVPRVVASGEWPSCADRGPKLAALYFEWALLENRPDLSNGGLHLPVSEDGLYRFGPTRVFSASTAVALGGALDGCASGPRKVITELHVNWRHTLANQLRRVMADSGDDNSLSAN